MVRTLPDDAELHRQVHPKLLDMSGNAMSSAFIPKKSDYNRLSTRQGSLMSPRAAFEYHVALGLESAGSWTFFVRDAAPAIVLDDAVNGDAHASVCFDHCPSRGAREKLGKQIKSRARATYKP